MRVLVLSTDPGIPLYTPSGASAHLRGIAAAFSERGDEVTVAVPLASDHRGAVDVELNVRVVHHTPRRRSSVLREWGETWDGRALVERLDQPDSFDLIWERHALFSDAGRRLARRTGTPRVLELNAPLAMERKVRGPRRARRMAQRDLRSASRVICVSPWLQRCATTEHGCSSSSVRVVPNGTALEVTGDGASARSELGLDGLVLGFVGSHKPWHGLDRIGHILDRVPHATALLVGEGPHAVPRHPRIRSVSAVGPDRLTDLVAAFDVGLLPYGADAPPWFSPLKLYDYLAQGVPVVASDVGDLRAAVGDRGEVVAADDLGAWAAAVERQAGRGRRRPHVRGWGQVLADALRGVLPS